MYFVPDLIFKIDALKCVLKSIHLLKIALKKIDNTVWIKQGPFRIETMNFRKYMWKRRILRQNPTLSSDTL